MEITPLEEWIYRKISGREAEAGRLTSSMLEAYQLEKLQATISLARERSRFYRRHLAGYVDPLNCLADLATLPFTTADDLKADPLQFLCVSQGEIGRVVTLQSSGTTGVPKRLFFTAGDQALTIDFFQHGLANLVQPGDRVLILLPGERPGSVGDLLMTGLARLGVVGIPHGPVSNPAQTLAAIQDQQVNALVGIPTHVLALSRYRTEQGDTLALKLKSVLLSTDHVPDAIVHELHKTWGCQVFNHYGMTEMGLGGGVECQALDGYHLREADLYFEIICPETGKPVPDGQSGEVVVTTLTRQGMPLIRYRTGDISRFNPQPCPCGTVLKRMERVKIRLQGIVDLSAGNCLTMAELDEALFPLEGLLDYRATLSGFGSKICLELQAKVEKGAQVKNTNQAWYRTQLIFALQKIESIRKMQATGLLEIKTKILSAQEWSAYLHNLPNGANLTAKRSINILRSMENQERQS